MNPKITKLGLYNALFALVTLYLQFFVLYPLTKNVFVGGLPFMTWGFLIMVVIYWIQGFIFIGKVEKLEDEEGEQSC